MRKALLLALAMALLVSPFVTELYIWLLPFAAILAIAVWAWVHLRRQEPEVDENQLACELSEFVRFINVEDGK